MLSRFAETAIEPPLATSSATEKASIFLASEIVLAVALRIRAEGVFARTMEPTTKATSAVPAAEPPMISHFFLSMNVPPSKRNYLKYNKNLTLLLVLTHIQAAKERPENDGFRAGCLKLHFSDNIINKRKKAFRAIEGFRVRAAGDR